MYLKPLAAALLVVPLFVVPSGGQPAPPVFDPQPLSQPQYQIQGPEVDPVLQRHFVNMTDGTRVFVETYLPTSNGVVRQPVPTILVMTAYPTVNELHSGIVAHFVPLGYAVAVGHVPGVGRSEGCLDAQGPAEVEATSRVIEYLGRDAPWTTGRVGMMGLSYDAITQLGVASLGDSARTSYLKAIIPVAGLAGEYDVGFRDGVHIFPNQLGYTDLFYMGYQAAPAEDPAWKPEQSLREDRYNCKPATLPQKTTLDGQYAPYWAQRDARFGVHRVQAATLLVHGHLDGLVLPMSSVGWFNRLPAATPHKAIYGSWGHAWPDQPDDPVLAAVLAEPSPFRGDWMRTAQAWMDRYLMDLPTGVESWPDVQVQDSTRRWREVKSWPQTGGPAGQLALSAGGVLGATTPLGSTSFSPLGSLAGDGFATFQTPVLARPLHLTGMPVADLWVRLEKPQTQIHARLTVHQPDGTSVPIAIGARSTQYLQPLPDDFFHPTTTQTPPLGVPVRVAVRLEPLDVVAPAGSRLELRLGGATTLMECANNMPCTLPSPESGRVEVLHSCGYASALRFEMVEKTPKSLIVQRLNGTWSSPLPSGHMDGGLAREKVCNEKPKQPMAVARGLA
jgi:predicted acyl esterase